jgi:alcohol dehydrogenase
MKAAQITEYGDASAVVINDIDKPAAGQGEVLVEVYASSINPFDITVRSGRVQEAMPLTLPVTLGGDIAGVIAAVGAGVSHVAVGDKVYGQAAAVAGNSGAFAEFARTKGGQVAKAPATIDLQQAASLPLVGVSAAQALITHLQLQNGQKILITGGTGGIGSIAIQIAKHLGVHVTATATGSDGIALAQKLGAETIVDYKAHDIAELARDFDAVFDTVGGDIYEKALRLVKENGTIVSAEDKLTQQLHITAIAQVTKVTTEMLDKLREFVEAGVVTPQVDTVFPLAQTADAFRAKESGDIKGKVVILIKQ